MKNAVKKVMAGMMTLALVTGTVPANVGVFLTEDTAIIASAATVFKSGDCGTAGHESEVRWTLDNDGVLTISGTGPMADYTEIDMPWKRYRTERNPKIKKIVVGSGVTRIGNYAFYGTSNATSVEIPNTVTTIGVGSLQGSSINSVTIPDTVTTIGDYAFKNSSLTSINIPSTVTTIGEGTFQGTNINSVTIPDTVTTIGDYAFKNTSLTSINIPGSVTSIGKEAFRECNDLLAVNFENRTTELSVGAYAFSTDLRTITPEGLKYTTNTMTEQADLKTHILSGSNPITILPLITYTEVPAKEATCTTAGNIKYYVGSDNNLYTDDQGTQLTDLNDDGVININDTVVEAKGHSYTSPIWSWVKNNGEYTVSVTFKCSKCGDIVTPDTPPELTYSDDSNGVRTYTASIIYNNIEYTSTRNDSASYDITVNDTTTPYKYGSQVKAHAPAKKGGQYFIGWYDVDSNTKVSGTQTYYFYATRDMRIEARYADSAVEEEPVCSMNISRAAIPESEKQKISFTVDWELPKDYEFVEAGVVRSYTNDNPKLGGEGVSKKASTLQTARGTFKYNLNLSAANSNKTIYSKAYVTYTNKTTNEQTTTYTELFTTNPV
ncbi:leucine-rich repeat domain-containing protein [Ruminococcus albus]|uniref:Leucine rich repeat-containing protein n=1 Tax=Ruminococcus albus TaxID=1264 RepID=A0A1H7IPH7_RUMAL|nr:leucine-rich repeat domain-containing protein [Ruminococcus albus]SEK64403.1 Leucine rich repeat-containing protein [Ruminococcus albus]